jgi:adenine-specific DNA-methyltransferase
MTLVLRKLLASSTFAIAGALTSISNRLKTKLRKQEPTQSLVDELDEDYEALEETAEEWAEDEQSILSRSDRTILEREIRELDEFTQLATSIEHLVGSCAQQSPSNRLDKVVY